MPTRESFVAALALGGATLFGVMGALVLLTGALANLIVESKEWSAEMTAIAGSGVSLMFTSGIVMLVLAVVCGVAGRVLTGRLRERSPAPGRRA